MDKVKFEYKPMEKIRAVYKGVEIEIDPFLTMAEQAFLVNHYLTTYFETVDGVVSGSKYAYFEAQFELLNYIFQANTNLEVESLDKELYADPDFVDAITSRIVNYGAFMQKLRYVIDEVKAQKTAGAVLTNFIEKLQDLLDKVANVSPEQIETLQKNTKELAEKIENSSILQDAIKGTA